MVNQSSILILDSGIGGLSITRNIRSLIPNAHITYIADTAEYPYGQKTEAEVTQRVLGIMKYTIPSLHPDIVIIACNTASTLVLNQARELFKVPIIGVVPAIKPAALVSDSGVIGILATQGTVTRNYTSNLISTFAKDKEIHLYGSSKLVNIAEKKMRGDTISKNELKSDVENLANRSDKMDTIVLACTHFPIIKKELQHNFPKIKYWVDSGEAIANRALHLLQEAPRPLNNTEKNKEDKYNKFITTTSSYPPYQNQRIKFFLGSHEIETIKIN